MAGGTEHPGGQSPITVEVLNEVEVIIYLQHKQEIETSCWRIMIGRKNG